MSDLISREAAIAELSLRNELLHRQFEALEISREDGVYQICIDAIRALPAAPACEPVAWLCEDLIFEGERSVIMKEDHAKARMERKEDWRVIPLYAHPPAATAVKVKPLVWRDLAAGALCETDYRYNISLWVEKSGSVYVDTYTTMRRHWTLEAAKAAAQADYEARILAALEGGEA